MKWGPCPWQRKERRVALCSVIELQSQLTVCRKRKRESGEEKKGDELMKTFIFGVWIN